MLLIFLSNGIVLLLWGCLCSLGLTILGIIEGPCQCFAGGVVATTHSTFVISCLGI